MLPLNVSRILKEKREKDPKEILSITNAQIIDGWIEFVTEDSIDEVIKKIAKFSIVDLDIQEFSLEDIFMRYYDEGGDN